MVGSRPETAGDRPGRPRADRARPHTPSDDSSAIHRRLPTPITSFIGREREIARIERLLVEGYVAQEGSPAERCRLLTLMGTGGCGKTRLALRVATELADRFPDGVWLAELAPLTDPALVAKAVASAAGVLEAPGRPLEDSLIAQLGAKAGLLVLDNCEHLVDACARLAETLLLACPNLVVLATSRQVLGVSGERTRPVPSLTLPDPRRPHLEVDILGCEAVRLFVDRASAAQYEFGLTRENATAVAEICTRLDGIPLAIELAAARARVLTVEQIAARLSDRFALLTGGGRTALPRQQTLRAAIDWSYDLLSPGERMLFQSLSVFAGSWTLGAAEVVCAHQQGDAGELLDTLARLADKSLIEYEPAAAVPRYRMLETIREYASQKLRASGRWEDVRSQHQTWYLELVERAAEHLVGPEQVTWLDRLDAEHDNVRLALDWTYEHRMIDNGYRFVAALTLFWLLRGHHAEGESQPRRFLSPAGVAGDASLNRARALHGAGILASNATDFLRARRYFEEALEIERVFGARREMGRTLQELGRMVAIQADYATGQRLFEQSLAIGRETGDLYLIARSLNGLGRLALMRDDLEVARRFLEESVEIWRSLAERRGLSVALMFLGRVAVKQGDMTQARASFVESLAKGVELRYVAGIARSLAYLSSLAAAQGDWGRAARLDAAAAACDATVGIEAPPIQATERDEWMMPGRDAMGADAFEAALREGYAMPLEQAVQEALAESESARPRPSPTRESAGSVELTAREIDVLRLVAEGLTDAQVAERLVVSPRTVNAHLRSIYAKLEVGSRTAASRVASERKLV